MKKRLFSTLAALLMALFVLSACSQAADVTGVYTAVYDMTDLIGVTDTEAAVTMNFTLNLSEDGRFVLSVDTDSLVDSLKNLYTEDFVRASLTATGVAEEEIEPILASMGYESIQAFIDALIDQMLTEEYLQELHESVYTEGTYKVEGGEVLLNSEKDDAASPQDTATIGEDGSLTMTLPTEGRETVLVFVKEAE